MYGCPFVSKFNDSSICIQRLFYSYSTGFPFIFNGVSIYIQRGFHLYSTDIHLYSTSLRFYSTTINQLMVYFSEQTISGLQNIKYKQNNSSVVTIFFHFYHLITVSVKDQLTFSYHPNHLSNHISSELRVLILN